MFPQDDGFSSRPVGYDYDTLFTSDMTIEPMIMV